ncbi:MAG: hypothetical protein AAF206_19980 [Bacteroidota bacterium]
MLLLFAISLLIRWPVFGTPPGGQDAWLSAHSLITFEMWEMEGIASHHFSSVLSYPVAANAFQDIPDLGLLTDESGRKYYISYPPFGLLFPYFCHQMLFLSPSPDSLRMFGLLVQLGCAFLLWGIIRQWMQQSIWALFGSGLYLLVPVSMWYHCNVYFSEILVQLWALGLIWWWGKMDERDLRHQTLLGLICFLGVYTEWWALLLAGCAGLYALLRWRSHKGPFISLVMGSLLAIGLTLWQYSSIAGWEAFRQAAIDRFVYRSGGEGMHFAPNALLLFYLRGMLPVLGLLGLSFVFLIGKRQLKRLKQVPLVIPLLLISASMHHLLFQHFTLAHEFSVLKMLPGLILLLVFLGEKVLTEKKWLPVVLGLVLIAAAGWGGVRYHFYLPDHFPRSELCAEINRQIPAGDIFYLSHPPEPTHIYFLKRNPAYLTDGAAPEKGWYVQPDSVGEKIVSIQHYPLYAD